MWDLWWTYWHWDKFFPEYFGFPLSISFHRSSITQKNEKNRIIFITGLHNKPQDCGASVASAAGPFTTKKEDFVSCYIQKTFRHYPIYVMNKNTLIVSLMAYLSSDHRKRAFNVPHFGIFYQRTTRDAGFAVTLCTYPETC
jgi:hypothetical protein